MNMTTRPTSHLIHSGFLDILSLIPPSTQPVSHPQQEGRKPEDDLRKILSDHTTASPRPKPKNGKERQKEKDGRKSIEQGLKKRKVDKAIIGPPMDFRYVPPSPVSLEPQSSSLNPVDPDPTPSLTESKSNLNRVEQERWN
jgi:hypothetical protein